MIVIKGAEKGRGELVSLIRPYQHCNLGNTVCIINLTERRHLITELYSVQSILVIFTQLSIRPDPVLHIDFPPFLISLGPNKSLCARFVEVTFLGSDLPGVFPPEHSILVSPKMSLNLKTSDLVRKKVISC